MSNLDEMRSQNKAAREDLDKTIYRHNIFFAFLVGLGIAGLVVNMIGTALLKPEIAFFGVVLLVVAFLVCVTAVALIKLRTS